MASNFTIKTALIGTPNVGKTSLFNCLTKQQHLVGNWDGVTTDIANGSYQFANSKIIIDDLPGIYSLVASDNISKEEQLTCNYLEQQKHDIILINVINLDNISRDLYLTCQLLERNYNLIIAINNNNQVLANNFAKQLSNIFSALDIKVVCCNAINNWGLNELNNILVTLSIKLTCDEKYPKVYNNYIPKNILKQLYQHNAPPELLISYLEGDYIANIKLQQYDINYNNLMLVDQNGLLIKQPDVFFAKMRHNFIRKYFIRPNYAKKIPKLIEFFDAVLLHKYFGLPIFLIIIYLLFWIVAKITYLTQIYLVATFEHWLVHLFTNMLALLGAPSWLCLLVNDGLIIGIITLLNFIPSLFMMQVGLFILENSGYISRVVFLIDKLMGLLGLSGKSLIAMFIGFSCNVSAILSTKNINNNRDKIITILMTPFMSCNARLAVYSIFAAAFFPSQQNSNIIFCLYIIGILSAIVTGWLLQKTLSGDRSNLIMTLPAYRLPNILAIIKRSSYRVKNFLINSNRAIISTCVAIAWIKSLNLMQYNIIEQAWFKTIMACFAPMGISIDNWQAVVGLFSGLVAKEAIIGSLNAFYHTNNHEIYGVLYAKFGCQQAAFAYLLFVLLCFPCVAVISSIAKELNIRWAIFSVIWTTAMAYGVAVFYYQLATFQQHPQFSITMICIIGGIILFILAVTKIILTFAKTIYSKNNIAISLD